MDKMPIATTPLTNESLLGYIVRACDTNGHPNVGEMLRIAGLSVIRARFIPSAAIETGEILARFFGCDREILPSGFHPPYLMENSRQSFIHFYGAPVRGRFRDPIVRRVSPSSLRVSPHHRSSWLLRPLQYCPQSGERLISRCPNPSCGKQLSWERAYGVAFCEHCVADAWPTTDLRDNTGIERLRGDDLLTYSRIAGLLSTSEVDVPHPFDSWKGWEIFDFVVMLAHFLTMPLGGRDTTISRKIFNLVSWHANLMMAGRAVLEWPHGFERVVIELRKYADSRSGFYGRYKDVGELADSGRTYGALGKATEVITEALDSLYGPEGKFWKGKAYDGPQERISFRGAKRKHGINNKILCNLIKDGRHVLRAQGANHAPVFFDESLLLSEMERRRSLIPLKRLVRLMGFPMFVLEGLASSGHLKLASGMAVVGRAAAVDPDEYKRFEQRFADQHERCSAAIYAPLSSVGRRLRIGGHIVLPVVQGILGGTVRHAVLDLPKTLFNKIEVDLSDAERVVTHSSTPFVSAKMSAPDVALQINVMRDDIYQLCKIGLLRPAGVQWIDGESVRHFCDNYLSTRSIADRMSLPTVAVPSRLRKMGIQPIAHYLSANRGRAFVWSKSIIDVLGPA